MDKTNVFCFCTRSPTSAARSIIATTADTVLTINTLHIETSTVRIQASRVVSRALCVLSLCSAFLSRGPQCFPVRFQDGCRVPCLPLLPLGNVLRFSPINFRASDERTRYVANGALYLLADSLQAHHVVRQNFVCQVLRSPELVRFWLAQNL